MTTLEKVRLFERYLELTRGQSDQTLDAVLDKLLARKRKELEQHRAKLYTELTAFERQYRLGSAEFFEKFKRGEMGDAADFFDWSATWQLYNSTLNYLQALAFEPVG